MKSKSKMHVSKPVKVKPNDIMLGRGNGVATYPGNVNYRKIVWKHRDEYRKAKRIEKPAIALKVITTIRALKPPGRFIVQRKDNQFYLVEDEKAIEKIYQSLREKKNGRPPGYCSEPVKVAKSKACLRLKKSRTRDTTVKSSASQTKKRVGTTLPRKKSPKKHKRETSKGNDAREEECSSRIMVPEIGGKILRTKFFLARRAALEKSKDASNVKKNNIENEQITATSGHLQSSVPSAFTDCHDQALRVEVKLNKQEHLIEKTGKTKHKVIKASTPIKIAQVPNPLKRPKTTSDVASYTPNDSSVKYETGPAEPHDTLAKGFDDVFALSNDLQEGFGSARDAVLTAADFRAGEHDPSPFSTCGSDLFDLDKNWGDDELSEQDLQLLATVPPVAIQTIQVTPENTNKPSTSVQGQLNSWSIGGQKVAHDIFENDQHDGFEPIPIRDECENTLYADLRESAFPFALKVGDENAPRYCHASEQLLALVLTETSFISSELGKINTQSDNEMEPRDLDFANRTFSPSCFVWDDHLR